MSLCTPARASLMTGRYPLRYGMQYGVIMPGSPWGLPLTEKVLPEYMNEAGYESHMVGKWHLGGYDDVSLPSQRGFTTFLGYLHGEDTYYTHKNLETILNGEDFYDFGYGNSTGYYDVTKMNDGVPCSGLEESGGAPWKDGEHSGDPAGACYTGVYATDAFVGRAIQVLEDKTPWDEEPLFLYLAHQAMHTPVGPAPLDEFTAEEKKLLDDVDEGTSSPLRTQFAGVLLYLDKRIGELMDFLEQEGWLDNSIIVVASDNGGCPDGGGVNYPLRGVKQSVFEGGTKMMLCFPVNSHETLNTDTIYSSSIIGCCSGAPVFPLFVPSPASQHAGNPALNVPVAALPAHWNFFNFIYIAAGALDGVDHWSSLTSVDGEGAGDSGEREGPRTEMLYNWDAYILSSAEELTENLDLVQGGFRQGSWKLMVNVWCAGYYSFDRNIVDSDGSLDSAAACGSSRQCEECTDFCQGDSSYEYGDFLVNLDDDPTEAHNLLHEFPEIADRLRARAAEVVYSEFTRSIYAPVIKDNYLVFKEDGWWISPLLRKLPPMA
eukprot:jgi/Undpi1/5308/HiC_scaffold_2.g00589.m1